MADRQGPVSRPAHYLVRAAITAPSLHNSQPWLFVERADALELHADPARRLRVTDPGGRELAVSCGAALFNVRIARRHLGFRPLTRVCPDAGRRSLLAEVRWGPHERPVADEKFFYQALRRRRTHRGPFLPGLLPPGLLEDLADQCRAEGTELLTDVGTAGRSRIAEAVREAETAWRADPLAASEIVNWAPVAAEGAGEGPAGYPCPDGTAFLGRDYAGEYVVRSRRGYWREPVPGPGKLGAVVVLSTRCDDPRDWLRAGQALQRLLLAATARNVQAAFHTQPLEVPELRERLRRTVAMGRHPQLILRLGRGIGSAPTARRSVGDVLIRRVPERSPAPVHLPSVPPILSTADVCAYPVRPGETSSERFSGGKGGTDP
ncbi:Acg family FMN-binding oxidoreductase [Streptomyces sp. NPDC054796]